MKRMRIIFTNRCFHSRFFNFQRYLTSDVYAVARALPPVSHIALSDFIQFQFDSLPHTTSLARLFPSNAYTFVVIPLRRYYCSLLLKCSFVDIYRFRLLHCVTRSPDLLKIPHVMSIRSQFPFHGDRRLISIGA